MGVKLAVIASSVLALAAATPADYVASRQQTDGGFAEPGARSDSALTAWAVLGLKAAGRPPDGTVVYLRDAPVADTTDLALRVMALRAVGESPEPFLTRLRRQRRSDGRIGSLVNSTIWGVLALSRGERRAVRYVLARQQPSGGWSWAPNGAPDSNDTAAAIQALRWSGVRGRPIRRGLAFIRNHTARNGGVRLVAGREPDAQSTAWAVQAYLAAGVKPPAAAFRFLASLRRPDGSYRYSGRYAVTPAIVTAQVLPALSRKPFPLR
jgi:prenyltransferase beta subunit